MQPQQNSGATGSSGDQFGSIVCSQCGSPMPKGMRFCRSCGNRLGDGPAEYTETVRLPNSNPQRPVGTTPFYPSANAPLIQQSPGTFQRRRRRMSGMSWMWLALVMFFAFGGSMSALLKHPRTSRPGISIPAAPRSYFGIDSLDTTDGGVTFDAVDPPGGPADKAGLVGGDIITAFDEHAVKEEDQLTDLLAQTPIGKKVDVVYLRDGVSKTTQLTTISKEDKDRLDQDFRNRPEGKGIFGFDSGRTTKIKNAETNTYGVRLDYVETNGPADLFGIKPGDLITALDNVPIRTAAELVSRVRRAIPYTTVNVAVLRNGQSITIPVKVGKLR